MQRLPYLVMAGLLVASLAFWLIGGDPYWIVPLVVWPSIIAYAIWDRRQKGREGHGERLASR
ncbi:MAG: hypothetical protein M3P40_13110 [Actinomycetota bacterium]|nr:hypothetical protein [Actinomycetota bacterium]